MNRREIRELLLIVLISLFGGYLGGSSGFYHIHSFDHAFMNYHRNPSPENGQILAEEEDKVATLRHRDGLRGSLITTFFALAIVLLLMRKFGASCASFLAFAVTVQCCIGWPSVHPQASSGTYYFGVGAQAHTEREVQIACLCFTSFVALVACVVLAVTAVRMRRPILRNE